ncbi:hypothetical protein GQ600_14969 [Phytophthora cactorum]|nr:hypothetical protein GQ600_14969 [Phytophthora cactorum]
MACEITKDLSVRSAEVQQNTPAKREAEVRASAPPCPLHSLICAIAEKENTATYCRNQLHSNLGHHSMSSQRSFHCTMKMRSCGLFWHKAVVSLKFTSCLSLDQPQQGLLTIARRKMFGGKMEISLDNNTTSLISVSGKKRVRFGPRFHVVTLRAPTSAIYETWWSALKNALASPNFAVLPVIDARARQVTIAPVLPARRNISLPKHVTTLETVVEAASEEELVDDIPMLEVGGPSSPSETDILASWRTWQVWTTSPRHRVSPVLYPAASLLRSQLIVSMTTQDDSSSSDRISVYTSFGRGRQSGRTRHPTMILPPPPRASLHVNLNANLAELHGPAATRRRREVAGRDCAVRVSAKSWCKPQSERRPSRRITERLHPLLTYALF